jgi:hypothetical protein
VLRLIRKWLKAGVLDTDNQVVHPVTGTPQGDAIPPIMQTFFLQKATPLEVRRMVSRRCKTLGPARSATRRFSAQAPRGAQSRLRSLASRLKSHGSHRVLRGAVGKVSSGGSPAAYFNLRGREVGDVISLRDHIARREKDEAESLAAGIASRGGRCASSDRACMEGMKGPRAIVPTLKQAATAVPEVPITDDPLGDHLGNSPLGCPESAQRSWDLACIPSPSSSPLQPVPSVIR